MQITTFLMFQGRAEAAINQYVELFPNSRIVSIDRYGPEGPGEAGSVRQAVFEVNGMRLMAIDSPVEHAFSFTPSMSLFVDCDDLAQLERTFGVLSEEGHVLMPPGAYGFSQRFAWVADRFGVSWQLNLP